MKIFKYKFLKRAILVMAPLLFIACEKDNGEVGLGLISDNLAGLNDTSVSVVSYTTAIDSVQVTLDYETQVLLGGYIGTRLLGAISEPVFGKANAGIVAQLRLNTPNLKIENTPSVDSVILSLPYTSVYGDTTKALDFEVYELASPIEEDSAYFSSYKPTEGRLLGSINAYVPGNSGTMKIILDNTYFQNKIIDQASGTNTSFEDNEAFADYFNGIYIKSAQDDGSILYLNLVDKGSLDIYYGQDSSVVSLNFNQGQTYKPANFSIFEQDYKNPVAAFDLQMQDSTLGEDYTYVQSMGGVATLLKLPNLSALIARDDILINRAFIEIGVQDESNDIYAPSSKLEIRVFEDGDAGAFIEDFQAAQGDGALKKNASGDFYRFEITQHIFNIIKGEENSTLAVVPVNKVTSPNRTILKGLSSDDGSIKLKIYYTKK